MKPTTAALRGMRLALIIVDESLGAGLKATAQDVRDLASAKRWLARARSANTTNAKKKGRFG